MRTNQPDALELCVACCRWCMAQDNAEVVRSLACNIDPSALMAMITRHRIPGLAWKAFRDTGAQAHPDLTAELASSARQAARVGLSMANVSRELASNFVAKNIQFIFLKGQLVGSIAWGNPYLKLSADIDLLVAEKGVRSAADILMDAGFVCVTPSTDTLVDWHKNHKESVWTRDGIWLDLHSRVSDSPSLLRKVDIQSPTQGVEVTPNLVLPTLAEEELFAYLCVHGASSAWFRLKWLADLAALVERYPANRLEHLFARSQILGAGRTVHQALLLIAHLFGPLSSPALQKALESDRIAVWLKQIALRELLHKREPTQRRGGTAMIHLSQLALMPDLKTAGAELIRQARVMLARSF